MYISEEFLLINEGLFDFFVEKITNSVEKIKEHFTKLLHRVYSNLEKIGFNVKEYLSIPKRIFKSIKNDLFKQLSLQDSKSVSKTLLNSFKNISSEVEEKTKLNPKVLSLPKKILKSISLFLSLVLFQGLINFALMKITRSGLFSICFLILVVAPFSEEFAKRRSIKKGYIDIFGPLFVWFEFALYMVKPLVAALIYKNPIILLAGLIARMLAAAMHFYTIDLQKTALEKDPKEHKSYWIAVLIHGAWNVFAVILTILKNL